MSLVFSKLRSPWKRWGPGRKREDRWSVQLAKNQTILDKSQVPPAFRPRGPAKKQVSSAIDQVSIVFFADIICFFEAPVFLEAVWAWKKESIVGVYNLRKTKRYLINQVPPAFHAQHAHPTSPRSTGFCAIWDCISSSSSSTCFSAKRTCEKAGGTSGLSSIVFFAYNVCLFEDYICFSADCALRSPWKRWGSGKNRASLLCAICEKASDT